MTRENDKTLADLEQIGKRAEEDLNDLEQLKNSGSDYSTDIEALLKHSQSFIEGIGSIAEKMRKDAEENDGTSQT